MLSHALSCTLMLSHALSCTLMLSHALSPPSSLKIWFFFVLRFLVCWSRTHTKYNTLVTTSSVSVLTLIRRQMSICWQTTTSSKSCVTTWMTRSGGWWGMMILGALCRQVYNKKKITSNNNNTQKKNVSSRKGRGSVWLWRTDGDWDGSGWEIYMQARETSISLFILFSVLLFFYLYV